MKPPFVDSRGKIVDVLENENLRFVTLITFAKGAVRGNHYHDKTEQFNYVISGKLRVVTRWPGGRVRRTTAGPGSLFLIPRRERHVLIALEPTTLVVMTRGIRGGRNYEADTHRLVGTVALPTD